MIDPHLIVRNMAQFRREMESADKKRVRAAETVVRVEGYRLKGVLQREIRAGAPGGRRFAPLTVMARYLKGQRSRTAFKRLAIPVRYWADLIGGKFSVSVGYQDKTISYLGGRPVGGKELADGTVMPTSRSRLSASWLRIAEFAQTGGSRAITNYQRHRMLRAGAYFKKRGNAASRVFFIRAQKMNFNTPARPIIDPFWARHKDEAWSNILRKYALKLGGARI